MQFDSCYAHTHTPTHAIHSSWVCGVDSKCGKYILDSLLLAFCANNLKATHVCYHSSPTWRAHTLYTHFTFTLAIICLHTNTRALLKAHAARNVTQQNAQNQAPRRSSRRRSIVNAARGEYAPHAKATGIINFIYTPSPRLARLSDKELVHQLLLSSRRRAPPPR